MIKLENVSKSFGDLTLFKDLNAEFKEHEVTCILGGSGVGKTTLINLLSGLIPPDSGEVQIPKDVLMSYVFQEPRLLPWFDAYTNIDFVLKNIYAKEERKDIILRYLEMVGLLKYAHEPLSSLSGGMVQRVSLCRAFAYPSRILFLDEPFKGLDPKLKEELLEAFCRIYEADRRTVFFVTHDIEDALRLGDEIYVLAGRPASFAGHFHRSQFDDALTREIVDLL